MAIRLTENAAKQIQHQLENICSGISLPVGVGKVNVTRRARTFGITDEISPTNKRYGSHDTLVLFNVDSPVFLYGSQIDSITERLKQIFKFENLNVDSKFGCGESFNFKKPKLDIKNTEATL